MNTIVMLPTYKEAENLKIIVPKLLSLTGVSVLIIDDSSPDETKEVVKKLAQKYPGKIFFFQRKERGRATAGLFGLKKALDKKPDYIVEMDADLSHRPEDLKKMFLKREKFDVVFGSRFTNGGKDLRSQKSRQVLSQMSRKLYKLITGLQIEDVGSGFKCYKAKVVEKLLKSAYFSVAGTSICLELNFKIIKFDFKVIEVPIEFVDRIYGESKVTWNSFVEPIFIAFKLVSKYGRIR